MKSSKNFKTIFAIILLSMIGIQSFAIEGYKDLKFGISKEKVIASKICSFNTFNPGQIGVKGIACTDFKFGGKTTNAAAFFINDKFLRFVIEPSIDIIEGLSKGLVKKYGAPSSMSTDNEFNAVDNHPNKEAFLAFDNNTVYLKIMSDKVNIQTTILIYTSPLYDILLSKNQENSLKDDL